MSSSPERDIWDDWFSETHGGTGELEMDGDVDECVEDLSFDDPESW